MSGATFDWTFPQTFSIRTAPPLENANVSQQGRNVDLSQQGRNVDLSQQGTMTTEAQPQ